MRTTLEQAIRAGAAALLIVAALGLAAIAADPARSDPVSDCNDSREPGVRIAACTALIAMGPAPEVLAIALMNRAIGRASKGDLDSALADLDDALEVSPGLLPALYNRGNVHLDLGHDAEAEADFTAVIERAPDFSLAWLNRGLVRERIGNRAGARSDVSKALKLEPSLDAARRAAARLRNKG